MIENPSPRTRRTRECLYNSDPMTVALCAQGRQILKMAFFIVCIYHLIYLKEKYLNIKEQKEL